MWSISMLEIQYERAKKPKKNPSSAEVWSTSTQTAAPRQDKSFNILWKNTVLSTAAHIVLLIHSVNYNSNLSTGSHLCDSCSRVTTGCFDATSELQFIALSSGVSEMCNTSQSQCNPTLLWRKWQSNANRGINSAKRWDILLPCTISICSQYSLISFQGHRGTGANTQTDLWGDQIWRQSVNEDWATGGWIY